MGATRLRFRNADPVDTARIVPLLNSAFRTPIDAATWEWYVYGNPLGHSQIYLAVEPDDRIVGIIAFAPISLRVMGARVIGDFAHHLVIEPAYRDTMSFVALNRHALNAQASLGRELVVGPPNRTAYPIHKTIMKWVDFGYLECLRKLKPSATGHGCQRSAQLPIDFDRFAEAISAPLAFCVLKDRHWMNWRFCDRPGSPYTLYTVTRNHQLSGYVVLKRWQDANGYKKAHILDMHAVDSNSLSELISAAESYASDCDELNLWSLQGYVYRETLASLGFAPNPAAHQPFIARPYNGSRITFPAGPTSFGYGDGDTLY